MWILLLLFWADPASFENTLRAGLEALQHNNLPVARARLEDASRMQPASPQSLDRAGPDLLEIEAARSRALGRRQSRIRRS